MTVALVDWVEIGMVRLVKVSVINQITMDFFGVKQKQGKYLIKPEDGELIFGERIWKD